MRKFSFLTVLVLLGLGLRAQTPDAFTYQAVARDAAGALIHGPISLRVSVLDSAVNGRVLYIEEHRSVDARDGLFSLVIGSGLPQTLGAGTPLFRELNWAGNAKFLKMEMAPGASTNFTLIGVSPLLSVPYAKHSDGAGSLSLPALPPSLIVPGTNHTATYRQHWRWEQNGHYYVLYTTNNNLNWYESQQLARRLKGHLLTITSAEENSFLLSNILSRPDCQGHIPLGYTDAANEGHWRWVTGEIGLPNAVGTGTAGRDYNNWANTQPDNAGGAEHIGHIYNATLSPSRQWNDVTINAPPTTSTSFTAIIIEYSDRISP